MSSATNSYGHYTDTPINRQWRCRFDVLFIPEDHRKILNRQPVVQHIVFNNGLRIVVFLLDIKVISN